MSFCLRWKSWKLLASDEWGQSVNLLLKVLSSSCFKCACLNTSTTLKIQRRRLNLECQFRQLLSHVFWLFPMLSSSASSYTWRLRLVKLVSSIIASFASTAGLAGSLIMTTWFLPHRKFRRKTNSHPLKKLICKVKLNWTTKISRVNFFVSRCRSTSYSPTEQSWPCLRRWLLSHPCPMKKICRSLSLAKQST